MRAKNMQALTNDIAREFPGVVIYGIGDDAHKKQISGHNEDDTPGVRAELQDADNVPEHRAIDVMLGPHFSANQAEALVKRILSDQAARNRLYYIIWNHREWSRTNGWKQVPHEDDPHTDHVHFSGWVDDDDDTAGWPDVHGTSKPSTKSVTQIAAEVIQGDWGNGDDRKNRLTAAGYNYSAVQAEVDRQLGGSKPSAPAFTPLKVGSKGNAVYALQDFFRRAFPAYREDVSVRRNEVIAVDGDFGPQTEAWVKEFQKRTGLNQDGIVGASTVAKLRSYGYNA